MHTLSKDSTFVLGLWKKISCSFLFLLAEYCKVYFADAYAAWQRGSNENSNGLLREYYPKKTDYRKINIIK